MDNRLLDATWTYHDGTKHSSESVRTNAHFLDWPTQPLPFKVYSTLEPTYFLADLPRILERFGNRGYRAAQLEAAISGGKLYLSAYTQRLGATGLTFSDDDVTAFFSPHAAGKSVMFLIALGRSVRRNAERGQ